MPSQIRTQQFVRSVKYVPGGVQTLEIPRMADIESLILSLRGTFTYPAGATGALKTLGAQALIQRVELVCDGKITVLSAPGWKFGLGSERTFQNSGGYKVGVNSMTAPAANANGIVDTDLYIDLAQFDGLRPKDSSLRVRDFSIVELKLTFATWDACFQNTASIPTVFDITVFCDGSFCTEADPQGTKPKFVVKRMSQVIGATNSNSAQQINLPAGNTLRAVTFYTHVNGVASDAILNNVVLQNGIDVRVQQSMRALNARMAGYRDRPVGICEIDLARQNRGSVMLTNGWAVPTPAQPTILLDYTGQSGATIEMVITEYVMA